MNFTIIKALYKTFIELYFDNAEEANFKSSKFKAKRWLSFFISVILAIISSFAVYNTLQLAEELTNVRIEKREIITKLNACSAVVVDHEQTIQELNKQLINLHSETLACISNSNKNRDIHK